MDIILSNSSDKPIYEQIASQIRAHILAGTLVSGEKLPSIRALANGLGVTRADLHKALDLVAPETRE